MKRTDIAIVGMSCIFPGAADVDTFWQNIVNKVDATTEVPADRIDPVHFENGGTGVDRFYCNRGGFIPDFDFDAPAFGILPLSVEGTEPDHLLTLGLVKQALEDAGVFEKGLSLDKTGIIIGKGNYAGPGATRAIEVVRTGEQIARVLKDLMPYLADAEIEKVKQEYQARKGRFSADTAMGLIPNLVASLVANRLNLGGAAYTLDAACASSLIAVDQAVQELQSMRCDMVIAGGVHVGQNAAFWSIFAQLGALSKKGKISPFNEDADGLLIAEGCGFVVLKRLEEAVAAGDKIYAVLKGVGLSSDGSGTSVMSPSVKGQLKAIAQAWERSGLEPANIGYIEAHGTGTALGDKTELETLSQFFGYGADLPKAGLGTVKSNIGHAMPASGIAGLIKTALALHHGILPPTLHCQNPVAQMKNTRFEAVQEAQDWQHTGLPKIAGVNAFGFGGINAHVVLEAYTGAGPKTEIKKDEVLLLARPSHAALMTALETQDWEQGEGPYRIAVFEPSTERINKALKIVAKNKPWRNKQDIWYNNEPLLTSGGKVAFVFPGMDGLGGAGAMESMEHMASYFNISTSSEKQTEGLLNDALKIMYKSNVLDTALKQLGVLPDMNAGHSLGEWLAARSAGLTEESSVLQLLNYLNPDTFELKDSRFIAVGCGLDILKPLMEGIQDLYLSNDNCPQQVILCGTNAALDRLVPLLKSKQIFHQVLPFQSGFHSPFIADKLDAMLEGMKGMQFKKTKIPLWSATTLEHYPEGFEAIRELSVAHLLQPVRFRELTQQLYAEGARVFIQVGSGGLIGFIDDTLRGRNISTISANVPLRSGIAQLQRVMAALFAEGRVVGDRLMDCNPKKKAARGIRLELGSALISNMPGLKALALRQPETKKQVIADAVHPLMKAFNENVEEMAALQNELLQLFQDRLTAPVQTQAAAANVISRRVPFSKKLDISLENCPYLIDHSLLRQPKGWPDVEDMDPVIPMTMIFELFAETAAEQSPTELVQKIMNIKVFQWMNVAKPFRETIEGSWKNQQLAYLDLDRFANAEVLLGKQYAQEPLKQFDLGKALDISKSREQIYESHMFHGPGYQGIKEITHIGENGISGTITGDAGKGSLLDNAGQLFGLWLQLTLAKERIAFPVKIQEIEFYGDFKDQQGNFECSCQLTELTDEFATADFILKREGKVWAAITGWQNRRLEIDGPLWRISMSPLNNRLSEEVAPGVFMFHNAYNRVVSWDFILKRYFNRQEKAHHLSLMPNKRKEWLISRVAVKDAVRNLLNRTKNQACFPIEFELKSDELGRPYPEGQITNGIYVSLAHKGTDAVGIAQYDKPVGIDIERIEARSEGFCELVFSEAERTLLAGKAQDEWATRFWVAKEAYGKYLGKGLQGNPKAYVVSAVQGEELNISGIWIKTIKHKNYIIGWTQ
ncbi:acyl transferase domain-containing protein/phosphopantetheinyl transferase [Pedobacter africanus]|uniref:Acyl transferase domain-containing protein/phosphopantetheinyl transferase n=1 Tax=Pedobacter africanus TaxID=151894 RepID=A0ACC6L4D9_9SPHI|nr:beta-ketoacyl synthase N-terminal-like domain-containing protein [Pedobacter africanus]MDR6786520.1 acyl transferase domain-containing protein/phosphopantetheinyl transferase [Pedobacter africanus]